MIRVFVLDDHPVIRHGLAAVLSDEPDFEVVGTAARVSEVPEVDVVVIDLDVPGEEPLKLAGRQRVVAFTAWPDRLMAALQAGVRGYVLKGAPTEELVRALRTVHSGEMYLEPRVAALLARTVGSPPSRLSQRQREILRLIAGGRSNKEIAAALDITERTAKFHVTGILNKLGAENRAQAVALALERGLL